MKKLKPLVTLSVAALGMLCVWTPALAQDAGSLATVTLADSTSLPLRNWQFSYEFIAWPRGKPQFQGMTDTRLAPAVWVKKKTYPVAGLTLSIVYGKPTSSGASVVERLVLANPSGKTEKLKPEPPDRDLLAPDVDKSQMVMARSLDLKGETITGTRRSFCLVSYTALVECPSDPSLQVTKIEFQ